MGTQLPTIFDINKGNLNPICPICSKFLKNHLPWELNKCNDEWTKKSNGE